MLPDMQDEKDGAGGHSGIRQNIGSSSVGREKFGVRSGIKLDGCSRGSVLHVSRDIRELRLVDSGAVGLVTRGAALTVSGVGFLQATAGTCQNGSGNKRYPALTSSPWPGFCLLASSPLVDWKHFRFSPGENTSCMVTRKEEALSP